MEIKKDNMIVTDAMDRLIDKDGKIQCGCKNPKYKGISFIDGTDFYSNTYQCICRNTINVYGKRSVSW